MTMETEESSDVKAINALLARASGASVEKQMVAERQKRTVHLQLLEKIQDLTQRKLYHELTDAYFEYLRLEAFTGLEMDKVEFFHLVIAKVKSKLNPLRLGQLLAYVCEKLDGLAAVEFMKKYASSFSTDKEAELMYKTAMSYHLTHCKKFKESEEMLEEVQNDLDKELGLDLSVSASFHKTSATLYQAQSKLDEYYKHAILYLSYTPTSSISDADQLAYEISLAAVLAKTTYNFGELLQVPIVGSMKDMPDKQWLYELMVAYHEGKWELYDAVIRKHEITIQQSPLGKNMETVRAKITLLALMELAFRKPKKHRKLTFDEIAQHCRIEPKEVEICLMKAMSNELMRGAIDEIEKVVRLSWVKPRILDNARVDIMANRLDQWAQAADELLVHLELLTPELLVS